MLALGIVAIALQGVVMVVDELWFHRRRGLPRWERIGHPLDTLTVAACLGWLIAVPASAPAGLPGYVALAVFSTLFVTKDAPIHARECGGGEQWLHALLFVLHPVVLGALALLWWTGHRAMLLAQLAVTLGFAGYQVVYWNTGAWRRRPPRRAAAPRPIDNDWYAELGARWYEADDTPIALLRAEARHRNPWIASEIARGLGPRACRVLDLGCGGGLLANDLGQRGHRVVGLDALAENLAVAGARDPTRAVAYVRGDACALPFADGSFDVVCAMDLLEHVEQPARLVAEASRVLAPGGLLVFHTFNRTWQANLIVIKAVARFVRNTPADLHVLRLFITPAELAAMCRELGLAITELRGSRPRFRWPLWRMLFTGRVGDDFAFTFTRSTRLGYTGCARKPGPAARLAEPASTAAASAPPSPPRPPSRPPRA